MNIGTGDCASEEVVKALKCPSHQIFSVCFPKEYIIW